MRVGIDAANLRAGGGITHLASLLGAMNPPDFGIHKIVVWGGRRTLDAMPLAAPWLDLVHQPRLDGSAVERVLWQRHIVDRVAADKCDLLFAPGGSTWGKFRPYVAMSQNLLPFDRRERRRYGCSQMSFKLRILRRVQTRTFRRADGMIFLNTFARSVIVSRLGTLNGQIAVVPHGVDESFRRLPLPQKAISSYSLQAPFRILYVSIIDVYKHQWHVATAVADLRRRGFPIALDLVGPAYGPALKRLRHTLAVEDPKGEFLRYLGASAFSSLPAVYRAADLFAFASTCENMPNILLEAMATGLPIACSASRPMPDILGDAGIFFDAEEPRDIAEALKSLIESPDLRAVKAEAAHQRAGQYTWSRCARETLAFLASVGTTGNSPRSVEVRDSGDLTDARTGPRS